MPKTDILVPTFKETIERYRGREQEAYADAVLCQMEGDDVNFIIESDQDTLYFRFGVPLAAFDEEPPQDFQQVKRLRGATKELEQTVMATFLRKVDFNFTLEKTNSTWAIYGDSIPLVVDETR